jgi:glutaconate CoA-transferase subunit B
MDFDPTSKTMRLQSVHEGQTVDAVRANTGFELPASPVVPVTPSPTAEELEILRREIDPTGILRKEAP